MISKREATNQTETNEDDSSELSEASLVQDEDDENSTEVTTIANGMYRYGPASLSSVTLEDLTQNFPTFSNLTLNLSFYENADTKSTYM